MVRHFCRIAIPAVLLLGAADAARGAQVRITGILGPDSTAVETSDDVELIPWGAFAGKRGIRVGQPLSTGDELRAPRGGAIVELTCADTAVFTLTGRFRVAIGSQAPPCRVDLGSGEIHVVGDANTGADVGGVTMGAVRTVYVIAAGRDRNGPVRRLTVFEGLVAVRGLRAERALEVSAGNVLRVAREPRTERVSESAISRAASLYARMDLGKARPDARESQGAYRSLYRAHVRVLETPGDAAGRLHLISEQIRYDATSRTTLYHIEQVAPRTTEARAATAALATVAYAQLGRTVEAAARYEGLQRFDRNTVRGAVWRYDLRGTAAAETLNAAQERQRMEPTRYALATDTLRVSVRADPSAARSGRTVRVVVTVQSSRGQPVPGAAVTVAAGGGEFAGVLGLESLGVTGDDGVFETSWRCARCASAYEFEVRATKRGYVAGESSARVAVR